MRHLFAFVFFLAIAGPFGSMTSLGQNSQKIVFDTQDSTTGYYLAIPPAGQVKGTLILLCSLRPPENILPETMLHNAAFANGLLTIVASMNNKLFADTAVVTRINTILRHAVAHFSIDSSRVALAGYSYAGNIALRYAELTNEDPGEYPLRPRAVFAVDSPVDCLALWEWSKRAIKKNFYQGSVGDGKYLIDAMTKAYGTPGDHPEIYKQLTPFNHLSEEAGNERFLQHTAVRLYYDTDIEWQLKNRRNSYYDTNMPDGSEMISRLLLAGNDKAEFVTARQGWRSNGTRSPNALSIVDEIACIQWLKKTLDIFDPATWAAPYKLDVPTGWGTERFAFPFDFAPQIPYKGVEELRFAPGWGDGASEEHWAYAFIWWLEGKPQLTAEKLERHLQDYYTGLVGRNIVPQKIPREKVIPVKADLKAIPAVPGDQATFSGTVNMLDYLTQTPMTLHVIIHWKDLHLPDHAAVFFEVSPRPRDHRIWTQLDALNKGLQLPQ
jgi:pimeloyl-ACP methyl ester carboxylesterase